jgi:hypothetical protein
MMTLNKISLTILPYVNKAGALSIFLMECGHTRQSKSLTPRLRVSIQNPKIMNKISAAPNQINELWFR